MGRKISMALASCGGDGVVNIPGSSDGGFANSSSEQTTSSHEHTFSESWDHDDKYHCHPSTCGHDVRGDEERHKFEAEVIAPTYEEGGYTTYTCTECGYSYTDDKTDPLLITITWVNYDGSVLETDEKVAYGCIPTYDGATPTRESDGLYDYHFAGWSPEVSAATQDATYTATFSSEDRKYTVDFDLDGGTSPSYVGPIEITHLI